MNYHSECAEILGGRRVRIRIEADTIMFYDLDTRELLRMRPNPLSHDKIIRLRGNRPAGPPPRPSTEPIRVQRRASNTGVIMVCGQKVALGRDQRHRTLTVHVSDTTLAIEVTTGKPASCAAPPRPPCARSKPTGHDRSPTKLSRPDVKDHLTQIR